MTLNRRIRALRPFSILLPAAAILAIACGDSKTAPPPVAVDRTALVAEADVNYTLGSERAPLTVGNTNITAPGGTLPTVTIATMTRTSSAGRSAKNQFLARIFDSTSAYATMGFAPGANYIWKDTAAVADGGPWRLLIVPRDTTYPVMWLKLDSTVVRYFPGIATEPRLVKSDFGYGFCANNCGGSHCPSDTTDGGYASKAPTAILVP